MSNNMFLSIDELRLRIPLLPAENRKIALSVFSRVGIDLSKRRPNLTGTGVVGFILENRFYEANSHKAVFLKVVEVVMEQHPNEESKLFEIKGTKKKYFSKNPADFKIDYEKIYGTQIYADTNENAAQLNRRCQRVLQKFGIDPFSLIVISR